MCRKTAITAAILLAATTIWAQKPLTLENTVPGGSEFYEHYNSPARGQFAGKTNDFVTQDKDGFHVGQAVVSWQQIDKVLTDNAKDSSAYIADWQDTQNVWVCAENGNIYGINLTNNTLTDSITGITSDDNLDLAPNFAHAAFGCGTSLYVAGRNGSHRVNADSLPGVVYGQTVHRNEWGIDGGTFWSESGRLLAFYRMDESMVGQYPIVNITEREATAKPIRYPMAGEASHEVQIGIYNTETENVIYLKTASPVNRFFTNIAWSPDDKFIFVAELNREQNHLWLNQYNADDGSLVRTLFEEENPEWVEPCIPPLFIDNNRFVWVSERDRFKHLYLYDTGKSTCKQLTRGNWCVTDLYGCNRTSGEVFFQANAEGYLTRDIYKVNLKGKTVRLSSGYGVHTARFSKGCERFVDNFSAPDYAILSTLRAADGKVIDTLKNVRNTYEGYTLPIFKTVSLKSADGRFDLCGRLILPPDFDSTKCYPVIDYMYGGPHSQLVDASWLYGAATWKMYFAQQGYIVFTMDNRGTESRGVDFEHCIHRRLGTCEMEDQMVGINYLRSLPYVDTTRIGIHGWSFGGFMTISMLTNHNDVFRAGVAGGPVCDWSLYEIMYGERYMDTPQENPEGYAQSRVTDKIGNLRGRLLVIHGDIDPVVVWQNSLQLLQSAVKADVLVDYAVYPQHEHNVIGPDRVHLFKRILQYFDDFLK